VAPANDNHTNAVVENQTINESNDDDNNSNNEDTKANNKKEKARRKREKQRQAELDRQRAIDVETANAGPSPRELEMAALKESVLPPEYDICEITADGNCLYRAVAAHCNSTYTQMRSLCADTLLQHADELAAFCELNDDDVPDFDAYCERVRTSQEWGGHLELRALAMALQRPIHVYSVPQGLVVEEPPPPDTTATSLQSGNDSNDFNNGGDPIRLSYHLHYYALGEHYNQVVLKER